MRGVDRRRSRRLGRARAHHQHGAGCQKQKPLGISLYGVENPFAAVSQQRSRLRAHVNCSLATAISCLTWLMARSGVSWWGTSAFPLANAAPAAPASTAATIKQEQCSAIPVAAERPNTIA